MILTQADLEQLYLVDLHTDAEIASMCGLRQASVSRIRRGYGIPTLGKTGRMTASLPELSTEQRDLIVGSLLGGGYVSPTSARTARFSEGHSLAQTAYLDWKSAVLGAYVSSKGKHSKTVGDQVFHGTYITTHSCTALHEYRKLFYPKGFKQFPEQLPDLMNPLVLAVWYQDDGSQSRGYPRISFGLDQLSLGRAVVALARMDLQTRVAEYRPGEYNLSFPGQGQKFLSLVREFIHPSMLYKCPGL